MQDHHVQFIRQPFVDSVDTTFFFAGGGRREIVDEIKSALFNGISLITLVGPEGSGKTMVCRMVEKELPAGLISVFLPRAVESFSDMVDIVGREVIGDTESLAGGSTGEMLQAIGDSLRSRGRRLVIIFEEAEKIYLATLERIRKMLDRVNSDDLLLHLVLSGRPALLESIEQLGIVAFQEVEERNLLLDDLDEESTLAYLDESLRIATDGQGRLMPADIRAGIYSASLGNFRVINQLANEYVRSEQQEEPFLVLLDTMQAANVRRDGGRQRRSRTVSGMPSVDLDFLALPKIGIRWLWAGGALLAVLAAVLFLVVRAPEDVGQQTDQAAVPIIELRPVEPLAGGSAEVSEKPTADVDEVVPDAADEPAIVSPPSDTPQNEEVAAPTRQDFPVPADEQPVDSPLPSVPPAVADDGENGGGSAAQPAERQPDGDNGATGSEMTAAAAGDQQDPAESPPTAAAQQAEEPVSNAATSSPTLPEPVAAPATERPTLAATRVKKVVAPVPADEDEQLQPSSAEAAPAESTGETVAVGEDDVPVESAERVIGSAPAEKKAVAQPLPVTISDEDKKEATTVVTVEEDATPASAAESRAEPAANAPEQAVDSGRQPSPARVSPTETGPAGETPSPAPVAPLRDSLYKERLAAGARWLVGGGSGRFTVQLMVLTSEQAEENLQQMLEEKEYRSVADNLFVLRRLGDPPTVMLYFGEYRTFAAAQQARNTLPVFLRKHDPYPIAVSAAVEKTRMLP